MMRATQELADLGVKVGVQPAGKVAYIMSRFPKITETFVLYEMLAMQRLGVAVEIYPLLRERPNVMHAEATPLVERAHYEPFLSFSILAAQAYFLRHKPRAYLGAIWALLSGTWGSLNFFIGALGIFPKTVYFAHRMAADGVTHVHAHFANHPAAAAFVIHRLVGIPYSFTAHGSDLHRDRHMLRQKVAEADFVVAISEYNRELIIEETGEQYRDKTVVIHCGVDSDIFKPSAKQSRRRSAPNRLTIVCVGTLHEVKGQSYLLEACRLLALRGLDFDCHFVGDGPDRSMLDRSAAAPGLEGRVHFHGQLTRNEIAQLLLSADVAVAPSVPTDDGRREGIPIVLMEAMATGLPVVASGISGIPELIEDGLSGILVPPRDAQRLAKALERLHTKPLVRRRISEAGRERVRKEFDLHKNAAVLAQRFRSPNTDQNGCHAAEVIESASNIGAERQSKQGSEQPYAIVIGLDSVTGLQTARILARHKVSVIGISKDPKHHFCRTNVCERILSANTTDDELITLLKALGPELNQKAVLFPCSDLSVLMISRRREELKPWYHVSLPEPQVVEMLMNKVSFYTYCRTAGLPIPATFFLANRADVACAVKEVSFPCILKPSIRSADWEKHIHAKVFKIASAAELLSVYERCSRWAETLILQEWIEGTDSDLYSCNCYFDAHSVPLVTFVSRKLRQWPPETGVSSLGEECRNDTVLQESIRLFQAVGYRGLGYVEMKRDTRTGKHFIIEPNIGRPTGRSAIAEAGGVPLLYAAYCDAVQQPLPPDLEQKYGSAKWIYLARDVQSALHYWLRGDLTLRQWGQSWRGQKSDAVFSWTDQAPFWGELYRAFQSTFSRDPKTEKRIRAMRNRTVAWPNPPKPQ